MLFQKRTCIIFNKNFLIFLKKISKVENQTVTPRHGDGAKEAFKDRIFALAEQYYMVVLSCSSQINQKKNLYSTVL